MEALALDAQRGVADEERRVRRLQHGRRSGRKGAACGLTPKRSASSSWTSTAEVRLLSSRATLRISAGGTRETRRTLRTSCCETMPRPGTTAAPGMRCSSARG